MGHNRQVNMAQYRSFLAGLALLGLTAVSARADWPAFYGIAVPPGGQHAWAARHDSVIVYHTSDFGESWQRQPMHSIRRFWDVFFADTLNGWTCGDIGTIFHTSDMGGSWQMQNLGGPYHANRLKFVSDSVGWACGDQGFMLLTRNAGQDWGTLYLTYDLGLDDDSVSFRDIDVPDPTTAWLVAGDPYDERLGPMPGGQGYVLKSENAGDSWRLIRQDTLNDYFGVEAFSGAEACIVGGDDRVGRGAAFITVDTGASWYAAILPNSTPILRAVEFEDRNHGWACGDSGFIVYTEDGGQSWIRQPTPMCSTLYDIEFCDPQRGMASGDWCVLVTTDGGANWRRSTPIGIEEPASALSPAAPELHIASVQKGPHLRARVTGITGPYLLRIHDALGRTVLVTTGLDRIRLTAGVYTATLDWRGPRLSARVAVIE